MVNKDYTGKEILLNELSKALNREITEEELIEAIIILKNNIITQFDDEKIILNRMREINIFNYIYDLEEGTRKRTLKEIKNLFSVSNDAIDIIDKNIFLSIVRILESKDKTIKKPNRIKKHIR